ncbi:MAG: ABC transporter permease [Paracoccus sp. (in: a-proteobacteria)]|uniref:ABC transporter permease n=1 Tax=unclassified Paracoccus (in: a-proteobacteria) TaxID=2688777 RepID=UPI000C48CB39|nr:MULTISPECIES: ABC transporter permease [unclassified Paracoccus (in: a-proteobacteria)]MAN57678.1 peptide ABC transporter [Paracoccus sp. (in: a-proteobacteria)]MDB2552519.1 ABC transporter permease [Paracoccus sp. (in: a-proteobacteria)]|tara:strand:- start:20 stop:1015 length:996 start_codon:yes stop_codon:yes gene_type:complete
MTETERQRHLDTAELVDESAGNAAVTADLPPDDPVRAGGETRSQWRDVWRQFRSHRGAMVALVLFVLVLLFVSIGPWLWTIDPTYVDIRARNSGFVAAHPLGTDQLGRDMLARLMAGGRVSIAVGMTAMLIAIFLGSMIGVMSGYFRRLDAPLMRITELFLALPLLPLLLLMVTLFREPLSQNFGPATGIFILIVSAIGATSWMQSARIVRGDVLGLKEREFILAAKSIGTPPRRMILRHILPNVLSPIMVAATLGIATAIITESALSFLGLGFPPDFPTWGRLLYDAVDQMVLYPSRVILPGIFISLTVLCVNYIGDGLRDAMDPRIRGR